MVKDLKLIDQSPLNPANQLKNFIKKITDPSHLTTAD